MCVWPILFKDIHFFKKINHSLIESFDLSLWLWMVWLPIYGKFLNNFCQIGMIEFMPIVCLQNTGSKINIYLLLKHLLPPWLFSFNWFSKCKVAVTINWVTNNVIAMTWRHLFQVHLPSTILISHQYLLSMNCVGNSSLVHLNWVCEEISISRVTGKYILHIYS